MAEDKTKESRGTALVTYKEPSPPALIGPLGDLEAFMRAAEKAPVLSAEQERSLALRLRDHNDMQAAQELILSHLRLVISIARGFLGYGLPYADLIQEGNIGLMKAIKHYDPDRGARLMTFAVHWIRSEIQEYIIRNWRIVKLATTKNQRKLFFNLRQMKEDSQKALTNQQAERIALTLDVKPKDVLDMEERMYGQEQSFDAPAGAESDDSESFAPADWLSRDSDKPDVIMEEENRERMEGEGLAMALDALDARSRRIIEARYLRRDADGNAKPMTLQELAAELGISAERVRQIEKQALAKMRRALASAHYEP
jgi:RNA polymerase sigma-32 factor